MSELKRLHKNAIPAALEKAERYRLLNEPGEAESICLDILQVDPENQHAVITLLLALTDRFEKGEPLRPAGHDDAILRWNTCARIIDRNKLVPRVEEEPIEFPLE